METTVDEFAGSPRPLFSSSAQGAARLYPCRSGRVWLRRDRGSDRGNASSEPYVGPLIFPDLPRIVASPGLRLVASRAERTVLGPIVRTDLWLTYENSSSRRAKASLHFDLPKATVPSGFAFVQNGRYVPGRLTDSPMAWRTYGRSGRTVSPSGLLAYPGSLVDDDEGVDANLPTVAPNQRIRVRLYTIGFVRPAVERLHRSSVESGPMRVATARPKDATNLVVAVSQRFGKESFVMGLIRASGPLPPDVEVVKALYGDGKTDLDVTERVRAGFAQGSHTVWARDADLGDPHPGHGKTLRLTIVSEGRPQRLSAEQGYRIGFQTGDRSPVEPKIQGLDRVQTLRLDDRTFAFFGRRAESVPLIATLGTLSAMVRPTPISPGADAARLWAYQMIDREGEAPMMAYDVKTILAFVKKYGVPCLDAAFLATLPKG